LLTIHLEGLTVRMAIANRSSACTEDRKGRPNITDNVFQANSK
jgi:hypothetical protein